MARFAVESGRFGPHETVALCDEHLGREAVFARLGATLLSLRVVHREREVDVTDGFRSPQELSAGQGGRGWILAPFSNRVDAGRYSWGGHTRALPVNRPKENTALHGFVHRAAFCVCEAQTKDAEARVRLRTSALRPDAFAGYPFAVDVDVICALRPTGLFLEIRGTNLDDESAPFGAGWHPYFRPGRCCVDGLRLALPARARVETDARGIPRAGAQAYMPIEHTPERDLCSPQGACIGDGVLDTAFGDLEMDADGWARTVLTNAEDGLALRVVQRTGLVHVFTGDP